jgi:hypothetical protein
MDEDEGLRPLIEYSKDLANALIASVVPPGMELVPTPPRKRIIETDEENIEFWRAFVPDPE